MSRTNSTIHEVDPARLASGKWSHKRNRQIGEGDISASYSAQQIAYGQPIRKPFEWQGVLWISVGNALGHGIESAEAYRLVSPEHFEGEPQTYGQKKADSGVARRDPNGFYHGMLVTWERQAVVLCGPPVVFIPEQTEQLDLFG